MADRNERLQSFLMRSGPARLLRLAYLKLERERARRAVPHVRISMKLALQGGGALGAFTWGVLDRLAEERALSIRAISGASAGALNAAVFASGLMASGSDGARRALQSLWNEVSNAAALASFLVPPFLLTGQHHFLRHALRETSRYGIVQLGINPLQAILARHVDIDALKSSEAPRLFISATNVLTGRARIFTNENLSLDALLASACVPTLAPTVWIDGQPYWDGGFSANPPLLPLVRSSADRILLVRLTRSGANKVPSDIAAIENYINTSLFSRPLEYELARISTKPALQGHVLDEIDATQHGQPVPLTSQPNPRLVNDLFARGRAAADDYVAGRLGVRRAVGVDEEERVAAGLR